MPIISNIESRRPAGRMLHAAMFIGLTLGALTMLYPFGLMIAGSLSSDMDEADLDLVPGFLVHEKVLYRKFLESKYNEDSASLNRAHAQHTFAFYAAPLPPHGRAADVSEFETFLRETRPPQHWRVAGGVFSSKGLAPRLREIQQRLKSQFNDDLEAFSKALGSPIFQWVGIRLPAPNWLMRQYDYQPNALYEAYFAAADAAPWAEQQLVSVTGYFLETHSKPTRPEGFALPQTVPADDAKLREQWVAFVREDLNPSFVTLQNVPPGSYQKFLRARYVTMEALNRAWSASLGSFDKVDLPRGEWLRGAARQDYIDFLQTQPPETYRLVGPEFAWRDWLRAKHLEEAPMPIEQMEFRYVQDNASALRWRFATSNYRQVFDELFSQGNGFRNTAILCLIAVALAIIINPLAAYAMSRFRLRGTYNILLILMATVAFPPMVTLIPAFIMLREGHLLNTFVALALPFAANGYFIFLLKGFFDSLPRELYEAATIDGASELRVFTQITMSLSTPILAVIALDAFNHAYTMFMYALIVCPSQDMWLQTVWLSQFQTRASTGAVFASVLVTCIPTLLVFVLAQRVIMRGIVVPTEK